MRTILLPAVTTLALLTGCAGARTTAMPFTGTWHLAQVGGPTAPADPAEGVSHGWLALAPDQVLSDVAGLPPGALAVRSVQADPTRGAAILDLENGLRLYLAAGRGGGDYAVPGGRVVGPADWLDVHAVRPGSAGDQEVAHLRLWSADSLAVAATAAQLRRQAPTVTGVPVPARQAAASLPLPAVRHDAAPPTVAALRTEMLRELEAARRGEAGALDLANQTEERIATALR